MFIVHKPKTTALPQLLSNLLIFTTRIKLNDQGFIVLNFSCIISSLCLLLYGQSGILVYEQRTMSWVVGCCIFGWIDRLST